MIAQEQEIGCPYCGETIVIVVDPSAGAQDYIEDCQVCCRPIEISIQESSDGELNITARDENEPR